MRMSPFPRSQTSRRQKGDLEAIPLKLGRIHRRLFNGLFPKLAFGDQR
jgi:hypothetical protein